MNLDHKLYDPERKSAVAFAGWLPRCEPREYVPLRKEPGAIDLFAENRGQEFDPGKLGP